jgi:HSP20 family protein
MSFLKSLIPSSNHDAALSEKHGGSETASSVRPVYEIDETPEAWALTVYLPGVDKAGLEMTVDDEQLRIVGRRAWKNPGNWTALYRESTDAPFELVINHDKAVDAEKAHAELADGVLRASLPKVAAIKPRKIAVN